MLTSEKIYDCLRTVMDPELHIDIVSLGLIYDVIVDEVDASELAGSDSGQKYQVFIRMTLTTPGCPLAGVFDGLVKSSMTDVEDLDHNRDVEIELTFDPPWVPDMMSEEARAELGFD
jgi:metal-sulfur cluster biosynthetic enzyme